MRQPGVLFDGMNKGHITRGMWIEIYFSTLFLLKWNLRYELFFFSLLVKRIPAILDRLFTFTSINYSWICVGREGGSRRGVPVSSLFLEPLSLFFGRISERRGLFWFSLFSLRSFLRALLSLYHSLRWDLTIRLMISVCPFFYPIEKIVIQIVLFREIDSSLLDD